MLPYPLNASPVIHERAHTRTREPPVPGMHTYGEHLTCVLWLQVEEPGKGEPLHLSGGQNVVPEEWERKEH